MSAGRSDATLVGTPAIGGGRPAWGPPPATAAGAMVSASGRLRAWGALV
jgi:hypothetical protein